MSYPSRIPPQLVLTDTIPVRLVFPITQVESHSLVDLQSLCIFILKKYVLSVTADFCVDRLLVLYSSLQIKL